MKISDNKPTIDLINQIKHPPGQEKVISLEKKSNKREALAQETVEISQKASDLNKIRDMVQKTPEVREEKVAFLREKIASGNYKIKSQEIAGNMLREFLLEEVVTNKI
jgi:negative regulator of flagellin synthesis FlgM